VQLLRWQTKRLKHTHATSLEPVAVAVAAEQSLDLQRLPPREVRATVTVAAVRCVLCLQTLVLAATEVLCALCQHRPTTAQHEPQAVAVAAGPPAGSAAAKRAAANAMRPLRGDDAALNLRDPAGQLLARDPRPLNSGATCDVWGYTYPEGTAMAGTRVAVKRIQHGRLPHQCRNNREDLAHLVKAMVPEGGLIPTEVTNAGSQETALIMEIGLDMGPGAGDTPMPVVERAGGLRAMARCARWLAVNNLGYIDFKLENMVAVNGVARCVDLVENVGDQRRAGSIHTFRMYRLIGRKARPVAEPVNCAAVKANEETMLYMMACTLLQMVACDVLVESEGPKESEIFAKGIPAGVHFTESEAVLLNFAFFDPQIRRQMKCAQFEQMVFDASKSTTADCWWNPQTKMVEKMP